MFKSKCFDPFNGIKGKYSCYRTDLGNEDEYFTLYNFLPLDK